MAASFILHIFRKEVNTMAAPGVSTLGVLLGYSATVSETKPSSFTLLHRINEIGEISLEVEQIDASALEDYVAKYVEGRADTGKQLLAA